MQAALDCYPCFLRQALQAARFAGADEACQRRVVEMVDLPVSPLDRDPQQFAHAIDSDVVIAKGMANFENCSGRLDFHFLFIAKCELVAGLLAERTGRSISPGDWILHRTVPLGDP